MTTEFDLAYQGVDGGFSFALFCRNWVFHLTSARSGDSCTLLSDCQQSMGNPLTERKIDHGVGGPVSIWRLLA